MSRPSKGIRLVWRDKSRKADGSLRSKAGWFIEDAGRADVPLNAARANLLKLKDSSRNTSPTDTSRSASATVNLIR